MTTRDDVLAAADRVRGRVRRTPVLALDDAAPHPLWLKCELLQRTGSFKARGALNHQLAARERGELDPAVGVVAVSGGNAGLAHAWAARLLGVPATVFVPATVPPGKLARLREHGAEVRVGGAEFAEAAEAALAHRASTGALWCHAYDQPEVVAGAGTLALELLDDVPDIDTVVVAVGGGGLLGGVAAALEGRARVVAVEPERIPTLHAALAAGEPVDVGVSGVTADSLGARRVGSIALEVARRTSPVSVLVTDDDVERARHELWHEARVPSEHGAATAWAGLRSGSYRPAADERVAVVVCGANTDPATLG